MQEKKSKTQDRAEKRAAALRDNLRKRKALQQDLRKKETENDQKNTTNDRADN